MSSKIYEQITDRVIELLESGVVAWRKPWSTVTSGVSQQNLASGTVYSGINALLLNAAGYASPYWVTYNQCKALGGNVKRGSKGLKIVYWSMYEKKSDDSDEVKVIPFLKEYTVFNAAEQCEGLTVPELPTEKKFNAVESAQQIVDNMPAKPDVRHSGNKAYYSPIYDYVNMPVRDSFSVAEEYYSTMFHELGHSTGHAKRLNRPGITKFDTFGSEQYSKEELIAEMSAAFLCGEAGIAPKTIENSAAYIQNWLRELKNDKTLIIKAAGAASKAAEFILCKRSEVVSESGD